MRDQKGEPKNGQRMKFVRWVAGVVFTLVWATVGGAQIKIVHIPQAFVEENVPIPIEVRLENDGTRTDQVRVYYKRLKEASFRYVELQPQGDAYKGELPAQPISAEKLQYFIMVLPRSGGPVTYPEVNPYYRPFEIQIVPKETIHEERQKGPLPVQRAHRAPVKTAEKNPPPAPKPGKTFPVLAPADYLILTPEPGSTVDPGEVVIAVSIRADSGTVDPAKTVLSLDGRPLSLEKSDFLLSATPEISSPGKHVVTVTFRNPAGKPFRPVHWTFAVSSPKLTTAQLWQKRTHGRVFVSSRQERVSGRTLTDNRLGGQVTVSKGDLQVGTRFNLTSQEDPHYQPRNRFLFYLRSPWAQMQLGDTSPVFTELMLRGKRVRGLNTMVDAGVFHLNVVTGQTYRAVEGKAYTDFRINPITGDTTYIDPVTGDSLSAKFVRENKIAQYGTFAQNLLGLRMALGKPSGFLWGLNLLKVKDNVHSIRKGNRPKDNLVVGTDFQLSLDKRRFYWKTEAAFSVLTEDIASGPISKVEVDTTFKTDLPLDPQKLQKWIILNASTVPLDPTHFSSLAVLSRLQLNYFQNFVSLEYKSIGAAYFSLGNSYLRRNIQGLFASDRIRLFENRFYLNLGYEDYADNFTRVDNNPATRIRTFRSGLNYFPGAGLPNVNLSFSHFGRNNGVTTLDSSAGYLVDTREKNGANQVTFNVNYAFDAFHLRHRLHYNLIQMSKVDAFARSRQPFFYPIGMKNWIHYLTLETTYHGPFKSILGIATNRNQYQGGLNRYNFDTANLRVEYSPLQRSLFGYWGLRFYRANGLVKNLTGAKLAKIDFQKYQIELGGRFEPWPRHALSLDASWILFEDHGGRYVPDTGNLVPNASHHDYLFQVRYDYRF